MENQNNQVLRYCNENGSIITYEAFTELGITRLSARIADLKKAGYVFRDSWTSKTNKNGEKVAFKRYELLGVWNKQS